MNVLIFLLKVILMPALVFLMGLPLLLEYLSFRKDREKGISHKRFRLLLFSVVYFLGITIVLLILKDLVQWVSTWRIVTWLCNQLAVSARMQYALDIMGVILLNVCIGFLFWLLQRLVRIGLKKKDLHTPKGKDGKYTFLQKVERRVLRFFYHEKWFFAAKILMILCIGLSAVYAILFLLYQLPVFFTANWIPYAFLQRVFEAAYLYPLISLIPLCQAYFFLAGVEEMKNEFPELINEDPQTAKQTPVDLAKVNEETQKMFRDYFRCQFTTGAAPQPVSATGYHEITKQIAEGIRNDVRNPQATVQEGFLQCIDTIVRNDLNTVGENAEEKTTGVLVNGGFFTEFSAYFLRYISVILSRGDNVVFVCNNEQQIDTVYEYVEQALSRMYSLYQVGKVREELNFDDPIWKICKTSSRRDAMDRARMDDCSVLITDVAYLCSRDFEVNHVRFANLIDTVVFVDALQSVNAYARQISLFVNNVKSIRDMHALRAKNSSGGNRKGAKNNEAFKVRYTSKQLKYVCFDDSRAPGLDKVLKNLLAVEFKTADAMKYVPETVICCYNYERGENEEGLRTSPQLAKTSEELGVLVNMADFALCFGGGMVSLFAQEKIPYADLAESLAANANNGVLARKDENLRINRPFFNPADYNVIVAFDDGDNLPAAVRRYAAMTPEKPTLVLLFSRAYLFRDYYVDNIEKLWRSEQLMRIPVERGERQSIFQRIFVQANAGGILGSDIIRILRDAQLPEYRELLKTGDINGILRKMLEECGIIQENVLEMYHYFEYKTCREFDKDGQFLSEEKICLRKRGALYDYVNSLDLIRLVMNGKEMVMPLPRERITQNFLVGQNLLYEGGVYTIDRMDALAGRMHIRHATGGRNNAPYQYLQDRVYYIDWSEANAQKAYRSDRRALQGGDGAAAKEVVISVHRRPMEVITQGYSVVDPRTLARNGRPDGSYVCLTDRDQQDTFQLCYRKYGVVEEPVYLADSIVDAGAELLAYPEGALVMSVKIHGDFGENGDRIANLAAAMLRESLHTMFPTVSDSLAVCPVVEKQFDDEQSRQVLRKQYKAVCRGRAPEKDTVEVLIIEDCASDLGAISVLMSSGDDPLGMLFTPIRQYLQWYAESAEKSDFLYFGGKEEPACFDFAGLTALAELLGDRGNQVDLVDEEVITQFETCDFCGRKFAKGPDIMTLDDGRRMCKDCGASLVTNDKKTLKEHLDRARMYLESIYGITLGDDYEVCFESTVKIANILKQNKAASRRGSDLPLKSYVDDKQKVHVEYDIPSVNLSELLVRELTHVWQLKNLPELAEDLAEGHIALVGIQYLRFLNQNRLAAVRTTYYESARNVAGEGYRKLIRELVANPGCNNNPFLYLLQSGGVPVEKIITPPVVRTDVNGFFGLPYVPRTPDRALDGNIPYFFYERLSEKRKRAYDTMLEAIRNYQQTTQVECSFADLEKVSKAILSDHPELFWYSNFEMYVESGKVNLLYCVSSEEREELQRRIDEVTPGYLEGIDDSMSAYDVAIRIHVRLINTVDYDTLALRAEEAKGGPKSDQLDRLRTICGVFLDGKAVCAGYARAAQYLLQKCGVECGYASGLIRKENGESGGGHGWNILKIDGDYYYMDTTWDDSSDTVQSVKQTDFGFDYFCITTEEVTRTRDLSRCPTEMPACTETRANYYYHNDAVMDTYDPEKLKALAQKAAQDQQSFFTFKCTSKSLYQDALARVCTDGKDTFAALKLAAKINKKISTESFGYGYDKNIRTITVRFKMK